MEVHETLISGLPMLFALFFFICLRQIFFWDICIIIAGGKNNPVRILHRKLPNTFARVSGPYLSSDYLQNVLPKLARLSCPQENSGFVLTIEINGCSLNSLPRTPVFPVKVEKDLWVSAHTPAIYAWPFYFQNLHKYDSVITILPHSYPLAA